jgi:hypothetical protein
MSLCPTDITIIRTFTIGMITDGIWGIVKRQQQISRSPITSPRKPLSAKYSTVKQATALTWVSKAAMLRSSRNAMDDKWRTYDRI